MNYGTTASVTTPPDIGTTLQTLTAFMASMSARMDALETSAATHTVPAGPQLPASIPACPTMSVPNPGPILPTTSAQPALVLQPGVLQANNGTPVYPAHTAAALGAADSAAASVPAHSQRVAERVRHELANIGMDDSSTSGSDSEQRHEDRKGLRKFSRLKSGRDRTTEDFVVRRVDWPQFGVYKGPHRIPAKYEDLTIQEFVFGYLGHILKDRTSRDTSQAMLSHLRELMLDATMYPWESVRSFHGIVLGMMEQDELSWHDKRTIQELRLQYAQRPTLTTAGPPPGLRSQPQQRHPPCQEYQRGACDIGGDHNNAQGTRVAHICAWCYRFRHKSHRHSESACYARRKQESKNATEAGVQ